jgi:hypothetical protein
MGEGDVVMGGVRQQPAVIDVPVEDQCRKCGKVCCNCELCVKLKGERNICGPCKRSKTNANPS